MYSPQTNTFFIRNSHKSGSQQRQQTTQQSVNSTTSQLKKSLIQSESISYLVFSRSTFKQPPKRQVTAKNSLPQILKTPLEPQQIRIKSEETKYVGRHLRKSSDQFKTESAIPTHIPIMQNLFPMEPIQLSTPQVAPTKIEEQVEAVIYPKLPVNDVLGESIIHQKHNKQHVHRMQLNVQLQQCEFEVFEEKSIFLLRKVVQLIQTNRERLNELSQQEQQKVEQQIDQDFSQVLPPGILDDKSPSNRELIFQQQLSGISKRQGTSSQLSTFHQQESLKPMKSLIESMKEKQTDKKQEIPIAKDQKQYTIREVKQLKIIITNDALNEKEIQFDMPIYMDQQESSRVTPQHQDDVQQEPKQQKQSNIYSMVSKSMLSKKYGSKLVILGKKLQQKQESSEFDRHQVSQYTRYYLQNNILRSLEKVNLPSKNSDGANKQFQVLRQTSTNMDIHKNILYSRNTNGTNRTDNSLDNFQDKGLQTEFITIKSQIYHIEQQHKLSLHKYSQDDELELDTPILGIDNVAGYKVNFISITSTVSTWILRQKILGPILSQIDDDSKNILLQDSQLFKNPFLNISLYQETAETQVQQNLLQVQKLMTHIHSKDKKKILKVVRRTLDNVCQGAYSDYINHNTNQQEKDFIQHCFINPTQIVKVQDNSRASKKGNMKVSNKETTTETIPRENLKLQILRCPSKKSIHNKSESPTINDSKKNVQIHEEQSMIGKLKKMRLQQVSMQNLKKSVQTPHSKKEEFTWKHKNTELTSYRKKEIQSEIKQINQNQSMDPFSLLFRNMLIQQTINTDKTLLDKLFSRVEDHNLLDLKELLGYDNSININMQDDDGNTLLIQAAKSGASQIVEYLMMKGADPHLKNLNGQTPMDVALENFQYASADVINKKMKINEENQKM